MLCLPAAVGLLPFEPTPLMSVCRFDFAVGLSALECMYSVCLVTVDCLLVGAPRLILVSPGRFLYPGCSLLPMCVVMDPDITIPAVSNSHITNLGFAVLLSDFVCCLRLSRCRFSVAMKSNRRPAIHCPVIFLVVSFFFVCFSPLFLVRPRLILFDFFFGSFCWRLLAAVVALRR